MISIVATTAFFTAVTADSNQTWLPLFDLNHSLDTPQPELEEAGLATDASCWEVTQNGVGYNLELAKFCKEVTDYDLQCAGEDLEGLPTATATEEKKTEEVEGERRLEEEEEKEEREEEDVEAEAAAEPVTTTISPEVKAELEANWEEHKTEIYDENIKAYGALVACIERNRYYSSSWWNTSWKSATYAKFTCEEVIAQYGDGSCDSSNSKKYALNVCCPKTCNTFEKLGCEAEKEKAAHEDAVKANEIGEKKEGEVCEGHSDCGENLQCGSESRPTTPAPATEEPTTTTEAPASEAEPTTTTEAPASSEAVRLLAEDAAETEEDAAETEEDAAETEEDAAETVDETKKDETVETETEEVETVETAQKKCQKAGASYYGFGFVVALLAVVSL